MNMHNKPKANRINTYVYLFFNLLILYLIISLGMLKKEDDKIKQLASQTYTVNKTIENRALTINDFYATNKNNNIIITTNTTHHKNQPALAYRVKKDITIIPKADKPKIAQRAPDVTFYDESDNSYTIKTFNNHLVVLYFWATWCLECTEELVMLGQLQKRLLYEDINDIIIIPISIDFKDIDIIYQLYQNKKINQIGLFIDKQRKLMQALNLRSIPGATLISKDNFIIASINQNVQWNSDEAYKALI